MRSRVRTGALWAALAVLLVAVSTLPWPLGALLLILAGSAVAIVGGRP